MKKHFKFLMKALVSLGLLWLVLRLLDVNQFKTHLESLSLPFVIFVLLYCSACQCLSCLRWQIVIQATGKNVSLKALILKYFAGMFLNLVLPGNIGGDVYRVYKLSQTIQDPEIAFASVLLERFAGLAAILGLGIIGVPTALQLIRQWDIVLLFVACTGVILGAVLLITNHKLLIFIRPILKKMRLDGIAERIAKIQFILFNFAVNKKAIFLSIGLSIVINLALIYYQYLIAQKLGIPISYLNLLIFTPILVVVTLIPISLGGIGFNESIRAYLFSRVGMTTEDAITLSLVYTGLNWLLSLPGGLILMFDSVVIRRSQIKNN